MQVSACFASADFHYSNSLASVQAHAQAVCNAQHINGWVVLYPAKGWCTVDESRTVRFESGEVDIDCSKSHVDRSHPKKNVHKGRTLIL